MGLHTIRAAAIPAPQRPRLGELLVADGALGRAPLARALLIQRRGEARLGEVLRSRGLVAEADLARALARQNRLMTADLVGLQPDSALIAAMPGGLCIEHRVLPWRRLGPVTVLATDDLRRFETARPHLPESIGPVVPALAPPAELDAAIAAMHGPALARAAESRCPEAYSCRSWATGRGRLTGAALLAALALPLLLAPALAGALLLGLSLLAIAAGTVLKLVAAHAALRHRSAARPPATPATVGGSERLPVITVLVPLHDEARGIPRLVARLERLTYPRELLDLCLVVEAADRETSLAARYAARAPWIRVIEVPDATLKTKPRALNYALGFARGSIVGIYDAEDAPDPDQLHRVARHLATAPPDVACVQGILDYYNAGANWLSRCFTIEYAIWFRLVLRGFERLGLPVPLGGTTVFFRRTALEALGGWDAHNVTEDADLGMRLVRMGWRCEVLDTVTQEEANCRPWPWVRQRARWLKGYAKTWMTHSRRPWRLLAELGWWRFFGLQTLFLGTLAAFLTAPLLWGLWAASLALPVPVLGGLPRGLGEAIFGLLLMAEAVSMSLGIVAVSGPRHRWLRPWVLTLPLYFPLAALAAWKAVAELLLRPFHWDKTAHGLSGEEGPR